MPPQLVPRLGCRAHQLPHRVGEMALAHNVGSAVEQAYRRSDQFEKRRQLAQAWARYIVQPATDGAVVPLRASRT